MQRSRKQKRETNLFFDPLFSGADAIDYGDEEEKAATIVTAGKAGGARWDEVGVTASTVTTSGKGSNDGSDGNPFWRGIRKEIGTAVRAAVKAEFAALIEEMRAAGGVLEWCREILTSSTGAQLRNYLASAAATLFALALASPGVTGSALRRLLRLFGGL